MRALTSVIRRRAPAIRERIERLQADNLTLDRDGLARLLIRSTRRRVAATGAASGATAIAPGLGTLVAIGTAAGQGLYALEQETELVLGISMIYGRELDESDEQLVEALVVVGLVGGAVRLRDNVLVAGGQAATAAAFRRMPSAWFGRVLGRATGRRVAGAAARTLPLAVGMAVGAGFDWVSVGLLGRAAMRYYGGPRTVRRARPAPAVQGAARPELESGG
jgi:UPF0271 protein